MYQQTNISNIISEQLPAFLKEGESALPIFIDKYYEFLESIQVSYSNLDLNEPTLTFESGDNIALEGTSSDLLIQESLRGPTDAFIIGETVEGLTSGFLGKVVGLIGLTDVFILPLSGGNLKISETFKGLQSNATATVDQYKRNPIRLFRDTEKTSNIFEASDGFIELFRKDFLPNIPSTSEADLKLLLTLAKDIYRTRGSEASFKWLWKNLYDNESLEFFYPKDYIFKVSDANWIQEFSIYVDTNTADNVNYFAGRIIIGSTSQATAIVESQVTTFANNLYITELKLSNIEGIFVPGEEVVGTIVDGIIPKATTLSLIEGITIVDGGTGYSVGDPITIQSGYGSGANAVVSSITDGAISEIIIADGGDGYLGNESITFFEEGTGGSGATARVSGIVERGNIRTFAPFITDFANVVLNSSDYGNDLSNQNINSHLYSNSTTTFEATVGDSTGFEDGLYITDTANSIIGTIIEVPDSTTIIYAISSDGVPNFYGGDNPVTVVAYYANGSLVPLTTTTIQSVAQSSNTSYYGSLDITFTPYGTISNVEVLTSGKNYTTKPTLSVTQNTITIFDNNDDVLGTKSKFLNFDSNTQYQFRAGNTIIGEMSGAKGIILDPYFEHTGNSTFSTLRYFSVNTTFALDSTDGASDENDLILLEDGYKPGDVEYTSDASIAGNFRLEDTSFLPSENVLMVGTSVNAVTSSSNTVNVDTNLRGNNAVLTVGDLVIGSITGITITNFGLGYTAPPTITTTTGDLNAQLEAVIGTVAAAPGSYINENSIISGKDKIQDSYYYQDFSYVLKTDVPITTFRDTVKSFIHPSGWALFGEIALQSTVDASEFLGTATAVNANIIRFELIATTYPAELAMSAVREINIETLNTSIGVSVIPTSEYHVIFAHGPTQTLDNSDISILSDYQIIRTSNINVQPSFDVGSIELEFSLNASPLSLSAQPTDMYSWEYTGGSAFIEENSTLVRTTPTIDQFFDFYDVMDDDEIVSQYMSVIFSEVVSEPVNIDIGTELFLDDIDLILEDERMVLEDGDTILLEDGYNDTDIEYAPSTSYGMLVYESENFEYEQATYGGYSKIKLWQKEEAKYKVQAVNSSSFTIYSYSGLYLPAKLSSLMTQDYRIVNI